MHNSLLINYFKTYLIFNIKLLMLIVTQNDEWNDLHIKALEILRFAAENPVIVDELIDSGSIPQILNYIKHAENSGFFIETLRIVVHVANTSKGRKVILCKFI